MMIDYNDQLVLINNIDIKRHIIDAPRLEHTFQRQDGQLEAPEYTLKLSNLSADIQSILSVTEPAELRHYAGGQLLFRGVHDRESDYDRDKETYDLKFIGLEAQLSAKLSQISLMELVENPRRAQSDRLIPIRRSFYTSVMTGEGDIYTPRTDLHGNCFRVLDIVASIQRELRRSSPFENLVLDFPYVPFNSWLIVHWDPQRHPTNEPGSLELQFGIPNWSAKDFIKEMIKATNGFFFLDHTAIGMTLKFRFKRDAVGAAAFNLSPEYGSVKELNARTLGLSLQWIQRQGADKKPVTTIRTIGNTRGVHGAEEVVPWATIDDQIADRGDQSDPVEVSLGFNTPFRHSSSGVIAIPRDIGGGAVNQFAGTMLLLVHDFNGLSNLLYPLYLRQLADYYYGTEFPSTAVQTIKADHILRASDFILSQWPLVFRTGAIHGKRFLIQKYSLDFGNEALGVEGQTYA